MAEKRFLFQQTHVKMGKKFYEILREIDDVTNTTFQPRYQMRLKS